jgi:hypothetical protein
VTKTYDEKALDRIYNKYYTDANGCFIWFGTLNNKGYAQFHYRGKTRLVHMVHYLLVKGEYNGELDLDHKCTTPSCVNPDHLEPVTHKVNNLRGWSGDESVCKNGHPRTEENTYVYRRHKKNSKPYTETQCKLCRSLASIKMK